MPNLLTNKIFLAGIIAIVICQIIKMIYNSVKDKKFNFRHIFELSGMPSAHTATVIALATMIYFIEGISNLFIVTVFLAIYVIDEVLWVEESVGAHSRIFNKLSKAIMLEKVIPSPLRERWGHTYEEVSVGAVIGFLIALFINYLL